MGRILLIEDDSGTQLLFKNRLEDLGHEVVVASTGARGLLEARAERFDLFLVDIVLGSGIDGYEVCRRLKGVPTLNAIPVVLISGKVKSREELHKGYEAGCESFLIKADITLLEDVVRAMLRIKSLQDDLSLQNRLLEEQNRRLHEERQRGADLEVALRETGSRGLVFRELAAGRPDGVLHVDADGTVISADRGARDILGKGVVRKHLGHLAPASGLEAFVRDAHSEPRDGYRFDLPAPGGRSTRSLTASVLPLVSAPGSGEGISKIVLLLDAGKRRVAAETLRLQEQGIPRRELGPLVEAARDSFHPSTITGQSDVMRRLRARVARVAGGDTTVLVHGESGVGKARIARTLHFASGRSGPLVPIDCAALAASGLESELFGHVKGAFPGAFSDRPGLFQQAHMGTLMLRGVEEIPFELQEKILRAVRDGEVCRVGSRRVERVDVRTVAVTSSNLDQLVETGRFRRDLLDVLREVELHVPPLREREGDVDVLTKHFIGRFGATEESQEISEEALRILRSYPWPGNVRELRNYLERASDHATGDTVEVDDLPPVLVDLHQQLADDKQIPAARRRTAGPGGAIDSAHPVGSGASSGPPKPWEGDLGVDAEEVSFLAFERLALLKALQLTGGDKLEAAKVLNVGKSTLYRKLKTHGIQ
jgi:DNA-binding NtrC family response regulator